MVHKYFSQIFSAPRQAGSSSSLLGGSCQMLLVTAARAAARPARRRAGGWAGLGAALWRVREASLATSRAGSTSARQPYTACRLARKASWVASTGSGGQ